MKHVCLYHHPWWMGVVRFLRNIVVGGRVIILPSLHHQALAECGNFLCHDRTEKIIFILHPFVLCNTPFYHNGRGQLRAKHFRS